MTQRRTLTAVAVGPLLVAAVACSGSSDNATPKANPPSSASSQPSTSPTTSHAQASNGLTAANFGRRLVTAQQRAGSAHFRMRLTTAGQVIHASGATSSDRRNPAAKIVMTNPTNPSQRFQMRLVDKVFYLKLPGVTQGKPWVAIDLHNAAAAGQFGALANLGDPAAQIKALSGATKVHRLGHATVNGVATTHYRVNVATGAAMRALGGAPGNLANGSLPKHLVYDAWVDGKDLLRKLTFDLTTAGQQMAATMTFSRFGAPVSVSAPPAGQVSRRSP